MTTFVWATAFVCWGIAALLVLSLAYPDLIQPQRWAGGKKD